MSDNRQYTDRGGGKRWLLGILAILRLFLTALAALVLLWRSATRNRSRACPVWLARGFEHPIAEKILSARSTLDRMGLLPGQRILEIGPGIGRLLIPAAQRVLPGGEAVGLDIQREMIERLKARAKEMGVANVTAMLGDATQPNFAAESFDVIYLCGVLGEIPDPQGALGQCRAALKPDGVLSVTEVFADPDYQSRSAVQRLAEVSGFRLREAIGPWYYFTANFVKPATVRQIQPGVTTAEGPGLGALRSPVSSAAEARAGRRVLHDPEVERPHGQRAASTGAPA